MSDRRARQAAEHGFTLLELLAAIMLLGLLMAVLFGGLRLGARVWETADARLDASTRIQIVQDFVRQRLAAALPLEALAPEQAQASDFAPLFQGTHRLCASRVCCPRTSALACTSWSWRWPTPARPTAAAIWCSGGVRLTCMIETVAQVEPEERVLVENIEALELAYFGTNDPEQPPGVAAGLGEPTGTASADPLARALRRERRARMAGADRPPHARPRADTWVLVTGRSCPIRRRRPGRLPAAWRLICHG